jgi:hypothetical protein
MLIGLSISVTSLKKLKLAELRVNQHSQRFHEMIVINSEIAVGSFYCPNIEVKLILVLFPSVNAEYFALLILT